MCDNCSVNGCEFCVAFMVFGCAEKIADDPAISAGCVCVPVCLELYVCVCVCVCVWYVGCCSIKEGVCLINFDVHEFYSCKLLCLLHACAHTHQHRCRWCKLTAPYIVGVS